MTPMTSLKSFSSVRGAVSLHPPLLPRPGRPANRRVVFNAAQSNGSDEVQRKEVGMTHRFNSWRRRGAAAGWRLHKKQLCALKEAQAPNIFLPPQEGTGSSIQERGTGTNARPPQQTKAGPPLSVDEEEHAREMNLSPDWTFRDGSRALVTTRHIFESENNHHSQSLVPGASSNPPDPHYPFFVLLCGRGDSRFLEANAPPFS
eukprot:1160217-Pelagomonas_calceolata.AAC.5